MLFREYSGMIFKRGRHRIVPAVEESEQCDDPYDFYDLFVVKMPSERFKVLWRCCVGHFARCKGQRQRSTFGIRVMFAGIKFGEVGALLFRNLR